MRLFVALWPDAAVRARLVAHRDAWRWPADARLADAAGLHATVHFLGAVETSRIPALSAAFAAAVDEAPTASLALDVEGTAVWPGGIAVLLLRQAPALLALHERLARSVAAAGLPLDERPYAPHVTLARRAAGAVAPAALPSLGWTRPAIALVASVPRQPYRVLAALGGDAPGASGASG